MKKKKLIKKVKKLERFYKTVQKDVREGVDLRIALLSYFEKN